MQALVAHGHQVEVSAAQQTTIAHDALQLLHTRSDDSDATVAALKTALGRSEVERKRLMGLIGSASQREKPQEAEHELEVRTPLCAWIRQSALKHCTAMCEGIRVR